MVITFHYQLFGCTFYFQSIIMHLFLSKITMKSNNSSSCSCDQKPPDSICSSVNRHFQMIFIIVPCEIRLQAMYVHNHIRLQKPYIAASSSISARTVLIESSDFPECSSSGKFMTLQECTMPLLTIL